ncbi:hypothetical protein, variant 1 [Fonticula alba]|uniref:6-phosphofructo-2-kinase domain-containing protein n=1 Tax=Fonticula alba TaxID=691883 RepID=A0A058Z081_FONAL|nr:hypothetical protein, variant 1 [Fonticula alba]KCV67348.1 hypothetical protein, variant 1 [Fonticula alba]|eukprot:XP_009498251.1 hypothetical protein, variant 1 [Fonticula alba]
MSLPMSAKSRPIGTGSSNHSSSCLSSSLPDNPLLVIDGASIDAATPSPSLIADSSNCDSPLTHPTLNSLPSGGSSFLSNVTDSGTSLLPSLTAEPALPLRLAVVLVGLPARGKSHIAARLNRYAKFLGLESILINVGQYRRRLCGSEQPAEFFDPRNETAAHRREQAAQAALNDMIEFLRRGTRHIAIFDATNSTSSRRSFIRQACDAIDAQVLFIESVCTDQERIKESVRILKTASPDYSLVEAEVAERDFMQRISYYESQYEEVACQEGAYIRLLTKTGRYLPEVNARLSGGGVPRRWALSPSARDMATRLSRLLACVRPDAPNPVSTAQRNDTGTFPTSAEAMESASTFTVLREHLGGDIVALNSLNSSPVVGPLGALDMPVRGPAGFPRGPGDFDRMSPLHSNGPGLRDHQHQADEQDEDDLADALAGCHVASGSSPLLQPDAPGPDLLSTSPACMSPALGAHPLRRVYLTRHGESVFNLSGQLGGDSDLSERGVAYARALGQYLRKKLFPAESPAAESPGMDPCASHPTSEGGACVATATAAAVAAVSAGCWGPKFEVWTSTLSRTIETASHLPPATMKYSWAALDELDAGLCDGLTYAQVKERYPADFAARDDDKLNYRYPEGESYRDVLLRLEPVLLAIECRTSENLLIVGHQAILRCVYAWMFGIPVESMPYIEIPLHGVLELTPTPAGWSENRYSFGIESVSTHRDPRKDAASGQ